MTCIFCNIVARQIYAAIIYEDDKIVAFIDHQPVNEGHILIIPRKHTPRVEEVDEETFLHLFTIGRNIQSLIKNSYSEISAFNYLIADGTDAGQEIPHVHLHIIPRKKADGF